MHKWFQVFNEYLLHLRQGHACLQKLTNPSRIQQCILYIVILLLPKVEKNVSDVSKYTEYIFHVCIFLTLEMEAYTSYKLKAYISYK